MEVRFFPGAQLPKTYYDIEYMLKQIIIHSLQKATGLVDIHIEYPENPVHGHYSSNVVFSRETGLDGSPKERAEAIKDILSKDDNLSQIVSKIEIAGAGFINFFLTEKALEANLKTILHKKNEYGGSLLGQNKKVVVEYSSPNIAKPFTIGHLRSTIIGDALANVLAFAGFSVYRDNHLGDWGTQFGKLIYQIKAQNIKLDVENVSIQELVRLYIEFHAQAEKDEALDIAARAEFKKLEEGDSENRAIWQFCIDVSLKEFKKIYDTLGVSFTENNGIGFGESFFEDKMQDVIDELTEKNMLKEGEGGAKLVFFESSKYPPLMIIKKDGATLYATRDLATDKYRLTTFGKDTLIINEVGGEQSLYFQQLFEVERLLGWVDIGQRIHVKHGHFRFEDKKMSTRKGDVIWLDDVIKEAISHAEKLGSDISIVKDVAIGALKWNELKRDPIKDIIFNWEEILNMEGNSGPYMQYTCARAKSVLKQDTSGDMSCEATQYIEETELMVSLARFPEIIETAAKTYSTTVLSHYLYDLAQKFNGFYAKHKINGSQKEEFRRDLTTAVVQVLETGLSLLGIKTVEKM